MIQVLPTHYTLRILTANMARYLKFGNEDFPAMNIEKLCIKYMILLNLPGEYTPELLSTGKQRLMFCSICSFCDL